MGLDSSLDEDQWRALVNTVYVKDETLVDQLSDYQFLKNVSVLQMVQSPSQ
jgi:hypothetical protein